MSELPMADPMLCPHTCVPDECEECAQEAREAGELRRGQQIAEMWGAWAEAIAPALGLDSEGT